MNKVSFIKSFELNTPSWDELLFDLNYSHLNQEEIKIVVLDFLYLIILIEYQE
jgi:hypothetical protein